MSAASSRACFARLIAKSRCFPAATSAFSDAVAKGALVAAGIEVRMSKAGVELIPGPGFDPAALEDLS